MDKLIQDLLSIEQSAKESLAQLDEERAALAKLIHAETAACVQEIILMLSHEAESQKRSYDAATTAEISKIENEYREKSSKLQELFDKNSAAWRSEWTNRVLGLP